MNWLESTWQPFTTTSINNPAEWPCLRDFIQKLWLHGFKLARQYSALCNVFCVFNGELDVKTPIILWQEHILFGVIPTIQYG